MNFSADPCTMSYFKFCNAYTTMSCWFSHNILRTISNEISLAFCSKYKRACFAFVFFPRWEKCRLTSAWQSWRKIRWRLLNTKHISLIKRANTKLSKTNIAGKHLSLNLAASFSWCEQKEDRGEGIFLFSVTENSWTFFFLFLFSFFSACTEKSISRS